MFGVMQRDQTGEGRPMAIELSRQDTKNRRRVVSGLIFLGAAVWAIRPIAAQQTTTSSQPGTIQIQSDSPSKADPATSDTTPKSAAALGAPTVPIPEIIQRFAAREADFKTERDNFTYTQSFSIQTLDSNGRPDGEYKMTSEIVFTPQGKRYEKVTYAPTPTLERISLSQQDLDDLEHVQPFVLTTNELPKYDVKYVDHARLDELASGGAEIVPLEIDAPRSRQLRLRHLQRQTTCGDQHRYRHDSSHVHVEFLSSSSLRKRIDA